MDAVFNLVGAVRSEPTTIADVAMYYGDEVSDMLWGISGMLRGSRALTLTYGFEERLFGVAEATGSDSPLCTIDMSMYPFIHRPFEQSSMFLEYLCYAQDERGQLPGIQLPRTAATNTKPIIREGNLRADGVL